MQIRLHFMNLVSKEIIFTATMAACFLGGATQRIVLWVLTQIELKRHFFESQKSKHMRLKEKKNSTSIVFFRRLMATAESRPIQLCGNALRRVFPGTVDQISHWYQSLESGARYSLMQIRGIYAIYILGFSALGMILGAPVSLVGAFAGATLGFITALILPNIFAKKSRRRMQDECTFELPEAIEMISLSIEAGMSFDQAINTYSLEFDGQIASRLNQAVQMWSVGELSRSQALESVARSLKVDGFTRFVAAVRQSLELGSMLRVVLDEQARQAREEKRIQLEKIISKAPVKMLIPMALCILPAMLMLVLGPIILQVALGIGGG